MRKNASTETIPQKKVPSIEVPQAKSSDGGRKTGRKTNSLHNRENSDGGSSTSRGQQNQPKIKLHHFEKINFKCATWCVFSNKFIWGLDKTGFECRDCGIACSRQSINLAKKTVCDVSQRMSVATSDSANAYTTAKIFTVHLPEGAKKSVLLNPMEKLSTVLGKICVSRNWQMNDYIPADTTGKEINPNTLLGQIKGFEITFTQRVAPLEGWGRPPLISDVRKQFRDQATSSDNVPTIHTSGLDTARAFFKKDKTKKNKTSDGGAEEVTEGDGSSGGTSDPLKEEFNQTASSVDSSNTEGYGKGPRAVNQIYDLLDEAGAGGFSTVYKAKEKEGDGVVAIKVIDKSEIKSDEVKKKFAQEFDIHSSLCHDNIIKFLMVDETASSFYVVMEFVAGGELFDEILERERFTERDAAPLICQVTNAIAYMHKIGIVHRDVKPENLLFTDRTYKTLKLADFGESKRFTKDSTMKTYCGTPDYMSPEIIKGHAYTCLVDMWALGVVSYVMMSGYPPFDGETDADVYASIICARYSFDEDWDIYSDHCKQFIRQLLEPNIEKRLTADQALDHVYLKSYCSEEMRTVKIKEPVKENSAPERPSSSVPNGRDVLTNSASSSNSSNGNITNSTPRAISGSEGATSPRPLTAKTISNKKHLSHGPSSASDVVDPLELGLLTSAIFPENSSSKNLLVEMIDLLLRVATYMNNSILEGELNHYKLLIVKVSEEGKNRTEFECFFITQTWERLREIKASLYSKGKSKPKKILNKK